MPDIRMKHKNVPRPASFPQSGQHFIVPKRAARAEPETEPAAEVAGYIAQLTREMAGMATQARFEMLAYFLNMAQIEAEMIARKAQKPS